MLISISLNDTLAVNAQIVRRSSQADQERLRKILSLISDYSDTRVALRKYDSYEHCNPLCRGRQRRLAEKAESIKELLETKYKIKNIDAKARALREKLMHKKRAKPLS